MNCSDNIIIIGEDHHNGLNLARMYGVNGIKVISYVISNYNRSWIAKSRFIRESFIFKTEKDAFDDIWERFSSSANKSFLFPYSDKAAFELDVRLNQFKKKFVVPSINIEQGAISRLMNKQVQYNFAKLNNINMAKSLVVDLVSRTDVDISFPCILKPSSSVNGKKSDIVICYNKDDYKQQIINLKQKGYVSILIQEYLTIDYELIIVGAIYKNRTIPSFSAHKIIRRWPSTTGSASFAEIVSDSSILSKCAKIMEIIKNIGYVGLIDVEVFVVNGEIYLNEINWRNSGGGFRAFNASYFYAYWWYLDYCEKKFDAKWDSAKAGYSMVNYADVRNIFNKNVTVWQWLQDYQKTKNFSIKFKGDNKPLFYKIFFALIKMIFHL